MMMDVTENSTEIKYDNLLEGMTLLHIWTYTHWESVEERNMDILVIDLGINQDAMDVDSDSEMA